MPRKKLSMRSIRETLRLKHEAHLSIRQIAGSTNRSYGVIVKYLKAAEAAGLSWPLPEDLDEDELQRRLFPDAQPRGPSKPLPDMLALHKEMTRPHVTLKLLWDEYQAEHPDGYQYSQFAIYYKRWRETLDVTMRLPHAAGEELFVDWAGGTIPWIDSESRQIREAPVFVAALGASSYTFCRAYPDMGITSWIDAHVQAFAFIQGVTRVLTPDNAKTAVIHANYYEPELHSTYQEMAEHYGTVVLPARVRKPRDKAKAEQSVKVVQSWVLAPLRDHRFFSVGEINGAVAKLLTELNGRPFQKLPGSRRSWFEEVDRPALKPLPSEPFEPGEWRRAVVNLEYHVQVDWALYSVPFRLVKQRLDVKLTASTVEIFRKGKRVAIHSRSCVRGHYSTDPALMPKIHQRYNGRRPSELVDRVRVIGPACGEAAQAILESKPHPEQGYRAVLGILRLGRDYGEERLERACRRAQVFECVSYRSIASILKEGLDRAPLTQEEDAPVIAGHANLRGRAYFQTALPLGPLEDPNGEIRRDDAEMRLSSSNRTARKAPRSDSEGSQATSAQIQTSFDSILDTPSAGRPAGRPSKERPHA